MADVFVRRLIVQMTSSSSFLFHSHRSSVFPNTCVVFGVLVQRTFWLKKKTNENEIKKKKKKEKTQPTA